jgi:uncharacterized membrane protein YedE/YeeE
MVMASGCGSKNLVRLGSGNLKALVVLVVLGVSALIALRGLAGVWRVATLERAMVDMPAGQDLPSLIAVATGMATTQAAAVLGGAVALALIAWVVLKPEGRSGEVWLGGAGIGLVIAALWWVSGRLGFLPEHPETLEPTFLGTNSRRMESLSMVAPVGYALDWLMLFSDKSKTLTIGIVSVAGVALGSLGAALISREFRWEGFGSTEDLGNHLVGAVLMGIGGVTALGCTVGQGLSGVSTLSLGSLLALASIIGGAVLALRYQMWRVMRQV